MSATTDELKQAKANLEHEIFELILKFKKDYKVDIRNIDLVSFYDRPMGGPRVQVMSSLKISIDI